jgi:hypothetical protein
LAEPELVTPPVGTSIEKPAPKKTAIIPAATSPREPRQSKLPIESGAAPEM